MQYITVYVQYIQCWASAFQIRIIFWIFFQNEEDVRVLSMQVQILILRKEEKSNFILCISSSRLMVPRANYLHDGSSSILAIGRCAHLSLHLRKFLLSLMEMFHLHKFLNSCGKNYCNYSKYFSSNLSVLIWKFVVSVVEIFSSLVWKFLFFLLWWGNFLLLLWGRNENEKCPQ